MVEGRRISLSNLDKVLYPETGFTKGEVLHYYATVAGPLLAHVHNRPVSFLRYPDGPDGQLFFTKNPPPGTPTWVKTTPVPRSDDLSAEQVVIADLPSLMWAANLVVELHTPQWPMRQPRRRRPDGPRPRPRRARHRRRVLRRRALAARTARRRRPARLRQDLRLQGHAPGRAAGADPVRAGVGVREAARPGGRARAPRPGRAPHGQGPAPRQGLRRPQPERRRQDHRCPLHPARASPADRVRAGVLGGGRGLPDPLRAGLPRRRHRAAAGARRGPVRPADRPGPGRETARGRP